MANHPDLFAPPHQPYYIHSPHYHHTSGGARALHYLCHALNLIGEEAYVLNPNVNPALRTPVLTTDIIQRHQAAGRSPIAMYPEVISDNPFNAKNVVRLLLAQPGLYTGIPIDFQPRDLIYTTPGAAPEGWDYDMLRIPIVNISIYHSRGVDDSKRNGSAVFIHRHLDNGGTLLPVTEDAIEISYRVPQRTQEELADIYRSVKCLYMYELGTPCYEALQCGCPVILILNEQSLKKSVPWIMGGNGISWGLDPQNIEKAFATVKNAIPYYAEEISGFWQDLRALVDKTQKLAVDMQGNPLHAEYDHAIATLHATSALANPIDLSSVKAALEKTTKKKKRIAIYTVESTWSPCPQIRLLRPFAHLADDWELVWGISNGQVSLDAAKDADLIILHRFTPGLMPIPTLESIFALGKPVVYESDDLLNAIPADHPEAATSRQWKEGIEYAAKHANGIVVSTHYLAEKYRAFNTNIHVLENYLDVGLFYRPVPAKKKNAPITIGLLGSSIQPSNFAIVESVLTALCDKYKDQITIHFVGWDCPEGWQHHANVKFFSFIHAYVDCAKQLQDMAWDIALIPLAQDDYNQCKSPVKWLDYSAAGIVSVFSDVSVYSKVVTHNKTGYLLPNTHDVWLKTITALIESPQLRQKIALAAQKEVEKDYNLKHHASQYDQVYSSFLDLSGNAATHTQPVTAPPKAAPAKPEAATAAKHSERIPSILILDPGAQSTEVQASLDSLAAFLPDIVKVVVLTTGEGITHRVMGASLQCVPVKPNAYASMLSRLQNHVALKWLTHQKAGHLFIASDIPEIDRYRAEALPPAIA